MDLSKLNEFDDRPKKKNPFRSKPIPKGKIETAINATLSIRAASQYLGVSYNTFKKYAKKYELFEQNKNQSGVGIHKPTPRHLCTKKYLYYDEYGRNSTVAIDNENGSSKCYVKFFSERNAADSPINLVISERWSGLYSIP